MNIQLSVQRSERRWFFTTKNDQRPYHLGSFPLESLPRNIALIAVEADRSPVSSPRYERPADGPLARSLRSYLDIFIETAMSGPAPAKAPVPDDPQRRMVDVKGYGYFMNASQIGICRIPANAWTVDGADLPHSYAVVLLVEHGRVPEADNPARDWIEPALAEAGDARIGGIAVYLSGHIQKMGFAATAHVMGEVLESPITAAIRVNRGEPAPVYNTPTASDPDGPHGDAIKPSVYGD